MKKYVLSSIKTILTENMLKSIKKIGSYWSDRVTLAVNDMHKSSEFIEPDISRGIDAMIKLK